MPKYYVVWVGRVTGVFTNWSDVKKQVDGFPRGKYELFKTYEEAEAAYFVGYGTYKLNSIRKNDKAGDKESVLTAKAQEHGKVLTILGGNIDVIYCEGVCESNPGKSGSGISVYRESKLSELYYGAYNPKAASKGAALNALYQAMLVAKQTSYGKKVQIFSNSKYAINCITDRAYFWKKNGWNKKKIGKIQNLEIIREIYEVYELIKHRVAISYVKAHVGIEGNELADRMAIFSIDQQAISFSGYTGSLDVQEILNF